MLSTLLSHVIISRTLWVIIISMSKWGKKRLRGGVSCLRFTEADDGSQQLGAGTRTELGFVLRIPLPGCLVLPGRGRSAGVCMLAL